ncbi:hypothetical protein E4U13_002915 [Claviceps humidiphila]|uniref:Uncharacterized protein n=2 Tax=Claviceps TaxID=5110 RepID=A0A9P7MNN4_9HYPO|nr:hypothetical protein E4U61_005597 [Claviceps capensis]KAG5954116.1 hypothetical protein E4U57_004802 [Claviceps arundinis]KAG5998368.1 hypothetical protein E4U52_000402 [Claviceps spartinae]KAG6027159.1 hypothetical protein E4U40_001688 [Claviceps sp. LM458 group G5]KAG6027879.1 hypothetical protein E4U19_001764 [Claviceps sp. Clav32 group G5]KAG6045840.1 hypothetical protein E4U39_001916 [Claviceps sp. Clav50 group G5]KAG6053588.1 hypothetical protein E4U17_004573 [Claviceps sp. LM77 grou
MAAIDTALVAREALNTLGKRSWPSENAGVMVVFVIVFLVACGIIAVYITKCLARRKERQPSK